MPGDIGDFPLTMDELRAVTQFVSESAEEVLPVFEKARPQDRRPREAIAAAREFVLGAARSQRQRVASLAAHRAAAEVDTEAVRLAARCAGDASAAAYLHPLAQAEQVGHILRAAALAARIAELQVDDPAVAERAVERARSRASVVVIDVLCRYPPAHPGRGRVAVLMKTLDEALRRQA